MYKVFFEFNYDFFWWPCKFSYTLANLQFLFHGNIPTGCGWLGLLVGRNVLPILASAGKTLNHNKYGKVYWMYWKSSGDFKVLQKTVNTQFNCRRCFGSRSRLWKPELQASWFLSCFSVTDLNPIWERYFWVRYCSKVKKKPASFIVNCIKGTVAPV